MISEYEFYWYWLASTQGVGAKRILSLAEQELNFAELFALAKQGKALEQFGLAPAIAKRLAVRANRELLEEELLGLKRKKNRHLHDGQPRLSTAFKRDSRTTGASIL